MYVSYIWYPYVPLELFTLPFPDIICSNLQGALVLSLKIVIPMGLQGPGSRLMLFPFRLPLGFIHCSLLEFFLHKDTYLQIWTSNSGSS